MTIKKKRAYPHPGTNAERVLVFLCENPRSSTSRIIKGLEMNPSVVRTCLKELLKRNLIVDSPTEIAHGYSKAGSV